MAKKTLIVLVGPTAVGKTEVSVALAEKLGCSILNADSRQVFKELDIGTAKPTTSEMRRVKHYFVGDRSINDEISAGLFEREALEILAKEFKTQSTCLMSGGSGLYIDAVCYGLNDFPKIPPEKRSSLTRELEEHGVEQLFNRLLQVDTAYAETIEPTNSQRIIRALEIFESSGQKYSDLRVGMQSRRDFNMVFIGLELPRDELYARINQRMDKMIEEGLFEEALAQIGYRDKNALQTVGYNEIFLYADGKIDKPEAIRLLKRNSRRFAKRQLTWFKRNTEIHWFHPEQKEKILQHINEQLNA